MITDLSHPPGANVIDGINAWLCMLSYITVDEVVSVAAELGKGTLFTKMTGHYSPEVKLLIAALSCDISADCISSLH